MGRNPDLGFHILLCSGRVCDWVNIAICGLQIGHCVPLLCRPLLAATSRFRSGQGFASSAASSGQFVGPRMREKQGAMWPNFFHRNFLEGSLPCSHVCGDSLTCLQHLRGFLVHDLFVSVGYEGLPQNLQVHLSFFA